MKNIVFTIMAMFLFGSAYADVIYLADGSSRNKIIVTKENFDKVHYYFKSSPQSIQAMDQSRVKRISRKNIPSDFLFAESSFEQKAYKAAIKYYNREMKNRSWTEQHCLFRIAECYRLQGKFRDAIRAYQKVNNKFPKGRYLADAYLQQGVCYFEQKKWSKSAKAYKNAGIWYGKIKKTSDKINADYKAAYSYEKKEDYVKAEKIYKNLVKKIDNVKYKKIHELSNTRIALCLLGKKRYKEGKKYLLKVINNKKTTNPNVLSIAYLGLGNYYLNSGEGSDSQKSLLCYLRVILLYAGNTADTAKAYKGAASCFKLMGKNSKARKMELYASRLGN